MRRGKVGCFYACGVMRRWCSSGEQLERSRAVRCIEISSVLPAHLNQHCDVCSILVCSVVGPAGSIAELCKDAAAQAWLLAELQATGKENKTKVRLVVHTLLQPSLYARLRCI
jgi:hypothetical protein